MTASIAERVVDAIMCRLSKVKQADGYRTDSGLRVFDSLGSVSESDMPCFIVFEEKEAPTAATSGGSNLSMTMTMTVAVIGRMTAGQDETGRMLRALKADAKRAVLCVPNGALVDSVSSPRGFAEIVYTGSQAEPRQAGDTCEGVVLNFDVNYKETFGDPYAQR